MRPGWHEPDPEPGGGVPPPAATVLVRTGSQPPLLSVGAVLLAGFLLLAIVKPWGEEAAARWADRSPSPSPSAVATPTPTAEPVLDRTEAIAAQCRAPNGWRVVTHQQWQDRDLRIWWAVVPVTVRSAWDPSIPIVSITADSILELGYCAPLAGPDRPVSDASVGVWRMDPLTRSAEPLALERIAPDFEEALVAIYAPPGSNGRIPTLWPAGRYLFAVDGRWFGVELRLPSPGANR